MELSRSEVVTIYNALKNTNLLGMSKECQKAFVVNSIKLKPIADKVSDENSEIAEKIRTEEYTKAFQEYLKAKADFDEKKDEKTTKALNEATKKFDPLFREMEENFNKIASELEQSYEVELLDIPITDYLEYIDKSGKAELFTFAELENLQKLLK